MALLTDSWPQEEAILEAKHFQYLIDNKEYNNDELCQMVIKLRQHWVKVFDDMLDMTAFSEEFNSRIAAQLNFYM